MKTKECTYQFNSELELFRIRGNKATIIYRGLKQIIVGPNNVLQSIKSEYNSGDRFAWIGFLFYRNGIPFLNENVGISALREFRLHGNSCDRFTEMLFSAIERNSSLISENYGVYFDERYNQLSFSKLRFVESPVFIGTFSECQNYISTNEPTSH
jgi:hypothetical protein